MTIYFIKQFIPLLCFQVLSLPGVGGLHVMPLSKQSREMTISFLNEGIIPSRLSTAK